MIEFPQFRTVQTPVTADQLKPPGPQCRTVQFFQILSEPEHLLLAKFLRKHPHLELRVYGHSNSDVDFLRHYPEVRHLAVEAFELQCFDGLEHVSPELESLTLGQTRARGHSLKLLERFGKLRSLYLERHSKDIDAVGALSGLQELTLRSITLPDLSILLPLKRLLSLDIKLGGTTNLELLPEIGRLRYLELWMIRGLADLQPVASVRTLQYLFLQALRNVTELPSLAPLKKLRRVYLETMKGLTDLSPVAKAPGLQELVAVDMKHLQPEDFKPFLKCRTLRAVRVDLGSKRKNNAVADLLGLPPVEGLFVFDEGT